MAEEISASFEYLSDLRHLVLFERTGWGVTGWDAAAHAPDREPDPLRIGDRVYRKGIGHHAPGELVIDLGGACEEFLCEVGLQHQGGSSQGSVVFSVFVDGEKRFESGVMRESDPPLPVRVNVRGAQELRLAVADAGDGIICDMADWAEARLLRSGVPVPAAAVEFDVARFGERVTCDPRRTEGARAGRTAEYAAEDVFLERPILENAAPCWQDGSACAGIVWLERRLLRRLEFEFPPESELPDAGTVRVEAWAGPTLWQGGWKPLSGAVQLRGRTLIFDIDHERDAWMRDGTRKVRWVLPSPDGGGVPFAGTRAFSRLRPREASVTLSASRSDAALQVALHNAEALMEDSSVTAFAWDGSPRTVRLRFLAADYWRSERPVLRIRGPQIPGVSIGIDDVLREGAVYSPDAGILAAADPSPDIAGYLAKHQDGRTILQRVREMPEQTFRRALEKTRNPVQDNGPTLLSLACDPRKFITGRDGAVKFRIEDAPPPEGVSALLSYPAKMEVTCGDGAVEMRRSLAGGWLPAPELRGQDSAGVSYAVRTFVAPAGGPVTGSPWLFEKSVCVTAIETAPGGSPAVVRLRFASDSALKLDIDTPPGGCGRAMVKAGDRIAAVVSPETGFRLEAGDGDCEAVLRGEPGKSCAAAVFIPRGPFELEELESLSSADLYKCFAEYWTSVLGQAADIRIPDPVLQNVILASQVHCLIAARSEEESRRVAPWIASTAYGPLESEANSIIRGMGMLGHGEFAARSLDYFIERYSPEGFLTTGYTLMGTGWHLWTLGRHYRLTRDREWLAARAGDVVRVCDWVIAQLNKTETPEGWPRAREHGLMPPGVMADWGNYAYYFYLNGYYCAGLQTAGEALADIGHPAASRIVEAAGRMREDIVTALERVRSEAPVEPLRDGRWVRPLPSSVHTPGRMGDFFPGEDGDRSWAYDVELGAHHLAAQGVIGPSSEEADAALDLMEDIHFLQSGWFDYPACRNESEWFDLGGFAKVQPYYGRYPEIYAMRRDRKAFLRSFFNMLASLLNTENLSLWEHFRNVGAWNKTHETGYFLQQARMMLVNEYGGELWLAPLVPSEWFRDGCRISLARAPTAFGPAAFSIESHLSAGFVEAEVAPPSRSSPDAIVLCIHHPDQAPVRRVLVDGEEWRDFDSAQGTVRLPGSPGPARRVRVVFED